MPIIRAVPDLEMNYLVDDYTDPWREAEAILLIHGNAESGAAWFGWVPHLARRFRVVRPDMRGFGASTPMPRDYRWSLDGITDDFVALMQALGIERFHLVGAKVGGTIARRFATRHAQRVRTLTLVGVPPLHHSIKREIIDEFEKEGIESWARRTMSGRLGSRFPPQGVEWWIKLMARTPVSSMVGFLSTIPSSDISSDLPRIACPTLVIDSEGNILRSLEQTRAWQQKIPRSTLLVLPSDSHHVAASDADRCALETADFITRAGVSLA